MNRATFKLFGGLLLVGWLSSTAAQSPPANAVLFENVRVFDGSGGKLSGPTSVLVVGNLIKEISAAPAVGPDLSVQRIAGNGRTAVEMYRSLRPRLVLMDVTMPEMNGYEASRAIRAIEARNGDHTPIIGVTAHALKGDREKCIEAGMDDYLPKPVSPDRLGAKIGTWLSETVAAKTA